MNLEPPPRGARSRAVVRLRMWGLDGTLRSPVPHVHSRGHLAPRTTIGPGTRAAAPVRPVKQRPELVPKRSDELVEAVLVATERSLLCDVTATDEDVP